MAVVAPHEESHGVVRESENAVPAQAQRVRYRPTVPFVALCSVVMGAFLLGLVVLGVLVAQTSFRLTDLQTDVAREEARYRRFRSQVATAESPELVAKAAHSIGLVAPEQQEYIVGLPGEAALAGREAPETGAAPNLKALLAGGGQGQTVVARPRQRPRGTVEAQVGRSHGGDLGDEHPAKVRTGARRRSR